MTHIVKEILINAASETTWTLMVQHLKYPEKESDRGARRWYYKFYFYTFKWDDEVYKWEELKKIAWKHAPRVRFN